MARDIFLFITKTATSVSPSWSVKDKVQFHYFNPNGVNAKFDTLRDVIVNHVDMGQLPNGYYVAYGSLSGAGDKMADLVSKVLDDKRVGAITLAVAVKMLEEHIERAYKAINKELGTNYSL